MDFVIEFSPDHLGKELDGECIYDNGGQPVCFNSR